MEKLYTVDDVAKMAGLTSRTIRNYLADGRLKGKKVGSQWRFTEGDIAAIFTQAGASGQNGGKNNAAQEDPVSAFLTPAQREGVCMCAVVDYPCDARTSAEPLILKLTEQAASFGEKEVNFTNSYDEENSIIRFTIIGHIDMVAKMIKTIRKD